MHLDFVDLRLVAHIGDTRNLARAAERTHISAPAASIRIKNLEEQLGVKLLYRTSRGVTFTPAGEAFLHHARQVLDRLEHLAGDMQEYGQGIRGHVRIWANTTAISQFVPLVLGDFLSANPEVNVDLREVLSGEIVKGVTTNATDIGIVAGTVYAGGLQLLPCHSDRLVLVTPAGHRLATRGGVNFSEVLPEHFVGLHEASAIHSFVKKAADALGARLKLRIQVGNFEAACMMIEAGAGVGIVPESVALRHALGMKIAIVDLNDAWAERKLKICVRDLNALSPFARTLVDMLKTDAEEMAAQSSHMH